MQPVQFRKFSKYPLLLFAFGLIVSLAGCAQPPRHRQKLWLRNRDWTSCLLNTRKK
jgi:hypothetical protein